MFQAAHKGRKLWGALRWIAIDTKKRARKRGRGDNGIALREQPATGSRRKIERLWRKKYCFQAQHIAIMRNSCPSSLSGGGRIQFVQPVPGLSQARQ
jgi:hypothetical protein